MSGTESETAKKVLVVDDDISFLDFICMRLKNSGFSVLAAREGREAIDMAKSHKPNVMLLDIMLPKVHGYEVCRTLRADEALKGMKIIFISAKGFKSDIDSGKALGADHYLVKPFPYEALQSLLEK